MAEARPPGDRVLSTRAAIALGLGFFLAYLGLGLLISERAPRLFGRLDLAFDADLPSRIIDLTRVGGAHYRTQLHPLFVLLLNPVGLVLRALLRGAGSEASGRVAAIVLTAAAGGAAVALFGRLLDRWGLTREALLAWSLLFGVSASQMVFAVLPETFVFSGLSLLLVAVVVGHPRSGRLARVLASIACFGMAVSNLAAVGLVRLEAALWTGRRAAFRSAVRLAGATVLISLPLAALQLALYPRTVPFYAVGSMARDDHMSFYRPSSLGEGAGRLLNVASNLFLFDLAAPRLQVEGAGTEWPSVDFPMFSLAALRPAGVVHLVVWGSALLWAAGGLWQGRRSLPSPALSLLAWVALHAALHSAFGLSLFLYSCHWTFAVVALAALGFTKAGDASGASWRGQVVVPLAVAALQLATNVALVTELLAVFRS
jgi:hypothetical protein